MEAKLKRRLSSADSLVGRIADENVPTAFIASR
jgi:hypothetical protein